MNYQQKRKPTLNLNTHAKQNISATSRSNNIFYQMNTHQKGFITQKAQSINQPLTPSNHISNRSVNLSLLNPFSKKAPVHPYKATIPKRNSISFIQMGSGYPNKRHMPKTIRGSNSIPSLEFFSIKKRITRNSSDCFFNKPLVQSTSLPTQERLKSIEDNEDDLSISSSSFPREFSNSINLNKYKITSLTNVATNNTTTGINIQGSPIHHPKSFSKGENNNDVSSCKTGFPELEITTNNIISDLNNNIPASPFNQSNNQVQIQPIGKTSNRKGTYIGKQGNMTQITIRNNENDEINTIIDNLSPHNNSTLPESKKMFASLRKNIISLPQTHKTENNRMMIEYQKVMKCKHNSFNLIKPTITSGHSNLYNDLISPQLIGNSSKVNHINKKRTHFSMPDLDKIGTLGSNDKLTEGFREEKISLINFLSVPRIMNMVIMKEKEYLIPCVFVLVPDRACITKGIESYLIEYQSIAKPKELNGLKGSISVSDIASCFPCLFFRFRFTIQLINDNEDNLSQYNIDATSNEMKMNYLKGVKYLANTRQEKQSLKRNSFNSSR